MPISDVSEDLLLLLFKQNKHIKIIVQSVKIMTDAFLHPYNGAPTDVHFNITHFECGGPVNYYVNFVHFIG